MSNFYVKISIDLALKFFEECIKRKIPSDDIDAKNKLLFELVYGNINQVEQICSTNRTKEQIIKDFSRDQRVLVIKPKEDTDVNRS
jgi:hypothetical protein